MSAFAWFYKHLCAFLMWEVWVSYKEIQTFFEDKLYRDVHEVSLKDLNTVKFLYHKNYYDTLSDTYRDIPNNKFDIKYISARNHI